MYACRNHLKCLELKTLVFLSIIFILSFSYSTFAFINNWSTSQYFENVELSVNATPELNTTVNLTLSVTSSSQSGRGNSTLQILLPNNFELIQGNLTWNVSIAENETVNLSVVVKAFQTGKSVIIGWAGPSSYPKYDGDELYISITNTTGNATKSPQTCEGNLTKIEDCMKSESLQTRENTL